MPRKPKVVKKPAKPPLSAICAGFTTGHTIRLTPKGPERERKPFSDRDFRVVAAVMGVRSNQTAKAALGWMMSRNLVQQRGPGCYVLTAKGAHVTDRACTVMARKATRR